MRKLADQALAARLYNKEIDEILVAGEAGYREAHDFHEDADAFQRAPVSSIATASPCSRDGVESQLDAMFRRPCSCAPAATS